MKNRRRRQGAFGVLDHTFLQQGLPHSHGVLPIDAQHLDGGSSDGRPSLQKRAIPAEMVMPSVAPGMKQSRYFSCPRIHARQVRAFEGVTKEARQRQVVQRRFASMFFRDDVVYLEGHAGEFCGEAAVLAAIARAAKPALPGGRPCPSIWSVRAFERKASLGLEQFQQPAHVAIILQLGLLCCG